jgi:hypothetical protein
MILITKFELQAARFDSSSYRANGVLSPALSKCSGRSLPFLRGPVTRAHPRVTDVGRFNDAKVGNHLLYHMITPLFPFSDLWYLVMAEDAVELAL